MRANPFAVRGGLEYRIRLGPQICRQRAVNPNSQEFSMHAVRTLIALSVATLATACASPGTTAAAPPAAGMAPMVMGGAGSPVAMDSRMNAMQEMHQKMVNAGTPAERQALMADHMKAMQGGMAMMKEMHAMHAGAGEGGMGMMQTMMDMMADRMPAASSAK
jgi:hypothetical protein